MFVDELAVSTGFFSFLCTVYFPVSAFIDEDSDPYSSFPPRYRCALVYPTSRCTSTSICLEGLLAMLNQRKYFVYVTI